MSDKTDTLIRELFGLRTHPFNPTLAVNGTTLSTDVFSVPLDPLSDERALSYYHDIYDWTRSTAISGLANGKLTHFPDKPNIINKGPLLVLLTGFEDTGRESLLNLLQFEIKRRFGSLFKMTSELTEADDAQNVLAIAQKFLRTYPIPSRQPSKEELKETYDLMVPAPVIGPTSAYHNLFDTWSQQVRDVFPTPLVLVLRGRVRSGTWRFLYNSCRYLFDFIFVLTHQEEYAKGCYRSLRQDDGNVALIAASQLDALRAQEYILARLACERLDLKGSSLLPFTEEAIMALFDRGISARQDEVLQFPIGLINKTLKKTIDDQLTQLEAAYGSSACHDIPRDKWLIGPTQIRLTRKAMNEGE